MKKHISRRMMKLKKAYKTEILLTDEQASKANQTIGVCRYVYNLYLQTAQNHYKETKKHMSGYDFSKWLNNVHTKETDEWIKDVSSKAVKQSIMNGIGIDLGISMFATCSQHTEFKNVNKTAKVKKLEKSLKRQQRKLSRSYEQNKNRKRGGFCAENRQKTTFWLFKNCTLD